MAPRAEALPLLHTSIGRFAEVAAWGLNREIGRSGGVRAVGRQAPQAVAEQEDVEVHQETDRQTCEPQVGHDLRLVNVEETLDRFQLDEDVALDDEIEPVSAVDADPLVFDEERKLSFEMKAAQGELGAEARFVGRLEEARPEVPMNLDASPYDSFGPFPKPPDLPISLSHTLFIGR